MVASQIFLYIFRADMLPTNLKGGGTRGVSAACWRGYPVGIRGYPGVSGPFSWFGIKNDAPGDGKWISLGGLAGPMKTCVSGVVGFAQGLILRVLKNIKYPGELIPL